MTSISDFAEAVVRENGSDQLHFLEFIRIVMAC